VEPFVGMDPEVIQLVEVLVVIMVELDNGFIKLEELMKLHKNYTKMNNNKLIIIKN
jgi:hypothetical protein